MKKSSKKPLKFLADESLGLKVAKNLNSLGFDILAVAQTARGASDAKVLMCAYEKDRIIITTDKDFGYLVFKERLATQGVILLRLKKESVQNLTFHLVNFLNIYKDKIYANFSVISENKIRIKKISLAFIFPSISKGPT